MYFQIVVGTGSYTTSTTNMYNKDVLVADDARRHFGGVVGVR
jgi:hypothetical protein